MDKLKISKNGAEIGGKDHYLDISWNEWEIEIEVFQSNGYDEHQASAITLSREQFDAIISAYQNQNTMTREVIQLGLDNQGFLVFDLLEGYEVDTEEEFIDKMLVEQPVYQALFWWDAILTEEEQMDFETIHPNASNSDEVKLELFNKRKR